MVALQELLHRVLRTLMKCNKRPHDATDIAALLRQAYKNKETELDTQGLDLRSHTLEVVKFLVAFIPLIDSLNFSLSFVHYFVRSLPHSFIQSPGLIYLCIHFLCIQSRVFVSSFIPSVFVLICVHIYMHVFIRLYCITVHYITLS